MGKCWALSLRSSPRSGVLAASSSGASTTGPSPGSTATTEAAPALSGSILFQRAEPVPDEAAGYTANSDGSDVEELFPAPAMVGQWSPDGTEISIFCCNDGGSAHVLNPDTCDIRGLEPAGPTLETICGAAWSPDGERLSCEGYGMDDPSINGICLGARQRRRRPTRITSNPGGQDTPGEYSPDGTWLVFVRFEDAVPVGYFVTNLDGTGTPAAHSGGNDP